MYLNRHLLWLNCCVYHPVSLHYPTSELNLFAKKKLSDTQKKRQNQWINEFFLVCQQCPSFFYFYGSSFLWSTHYMSQCCITKKKSGKRIKENCCNFHAAENQHTKNGYTHLYILYYPNLSSLFLILFFHICLKTISWIRRKDYHLLTVGLTTYSSDERFSALHLEDSEVILISYQVFSF